MSIAYRYVIGVTLACGSAERAAAASVLSPHRSDALSRKRLSLKTHARIGLAALIGLVSEPAASQLSDQENAWPPQEQMRAPENCPVPPSERANYALALRNVPAGRTAWTDGRNLSEAGMQSE